jgi:hypothetical protein
MARMPGNVDLLVMHANFLIEVHKDGQAAHTQIQSAQQAKPGILDSYNIYAAQQLSKKLRKGMTTMLQKQECCLHGCLVARRACVASPSSMLASTVQALQCLDTAASTTVQHHVHTLMILPATCCALCCFCFGFMLLPAEGDGLDLLGYVKFQRNYRCV